MIQNIENKIKIVLIVAVLSIVASVIISISAVAYATNTSNKALHALTQEKEQLYILDNGIPLLVNLSDSERNSSIQAEALINTYHKLFFTLPPDDNYINQNISQAMYLIDSTGVLEHTNLKERGYYNRILSSNAVLSIKTDSIHIEPKTNRFTYYGTQRIDRHSKAVLRSIVTSGYIEYNYPLTQNNPFGCLITDWRTLANKTISSEIKRDFR